LAREPGDGTDPDMGGGYPAGDDPTDDDPASDDPAEHELLEVGRIVKPHGLKGDVIVALTTNRDERVAPGARLRAGERDLRVERSAPHRGRFIVTFEGVAGIDAAEALRDVRLFAPPLDDPGVLWVHEMIGARVEDSEGGFLGTVEAVQANPASDLLVLEGGALIPLRFVVSCEPGELITVDIPEGLVDPA
jgi:16S rRNA processing protein RimM